MPLPPHMHPGMPPEYMGHPPYGAPYPPPPGAAPLPRNGSVSPPQRERDEPESEDAEMEETSSRGSPAIDPSLDQPAQALHPSSIQAHETKSPSAGRSQNLISHAEAEAAVKAVLALQKVGESAAVSATSDAQAEEAPSPAATSQPATTSVMPEQSGEQPSSVSAQDASADLDMDADADGEADGDGEEVKGNHSDGSASKALAPPPQGETVTEDGVAMLNPGEYGRASFCVAAFL